MGTTEENKATVRKIQNIVFGMLCDIDDFCKEAGIRYYLSGGTCLGAVRHQGFIPWDDDGDIMMPRPDYERFLVSFSEKYRGKYELGSLVTDDLWQIPYAQVCDLHSRVLHTNLDYKPRGVSIDIFAIDGLPENRLHQKIYYKKLRIMDGLRNTTIRTSFKQQEKQRLVKTTASFFTKQIGPRFFANHMDRYAAKFAFEDSSYVAASLPVHYGEKETIEKKYMETAAYLPFEGRMLPVPIGYDRYLTNLYGDYMKIPKDAAEAGYTHLDGWSVFFFDQE